MIKELQTMPNSESAIQHLQTKMLDFKNRYKPCKTLVRSKYMTSIYLDIIDFYSQVLSEYENDDVKLIVKVMKKFDVYNFRSLFQTEVAEYVKIFEEKFQELKEPIKRENEEFSNKLDKWFEEVYNKQTNFFDKYFYIHELIYQKFFITNARNIYFSFQ